MKEKDKKVKALELAEKVKLLFTFCADLIPDKDMIKETFELASERQSMSVSMAPILGAFGEDYKDIEFEARIRKERASALFELIDTLDRTEKERIELNLKKKSRQKGLAQIHRALGL